MNPIPSNEDYLLTLFEVCEILGKSSRTITRYVHRHILHPRGIKSRQGTLEYRFSRAEVNALKQREDSMRNYVYIDNNKDISAAPAASFADFQYPASTTPQTFFVPGISFPAKSSSPVISQPSDQPSAVVDAANSVDGDIPQKEKTVAADNNLPNIPVAAENKPIDVISLGRNDAEIISLLKETTGMLRDQLKVKDDQIKNLDDKIGQLIERNRETNILLKGLQDKIMLLEKPARGQENVSGREDGINSGRGSVAGDNNDSDLSGQFSAKNDEPIAPIKVKISSEASNVGRLTAEENVFSEKPGYAPRPLKTSGVNQDEKKGLLKRIFG